MKNRLPHLISSAFNAESATLLPALATTTRRRIKLWELPSHRHCTLIGTCLPVAEMRKLVARVGFDLRDMSDYTVHTLVIGHCANRSELAESVQRYFEKRYASVILRFSRAKDPRAVAALWNETLASGDNIAGALWAAWTHAAIDEHVEKQIFGDIHMLSHQVGASARCDLQQLEHHKAETARLRNEQEALRRGLTEMQRAHDKALASLRKELDAATQRASHYEQRELMFAAAASEHRHFANLQQRATALAERAETLEERNADNARRAARLEIELLETREELSAAEQALSAALGVCEGVSGTSGCGKTCPAEQELIGRCVLCIGGRTGLVDGYRKLVEVRGGRFMHHDGGQEESLHRIDAAVAAADAVVCQSACVSHAAYWRLKDACKKLNKPCVFVQSPGVGSFARSLNAISSAAPGSQVIRLTN